MRRKWRFELRIGWFHRSGNLRGDIHLPGNRIGFIELKHHDNNQRCYYRAVSYARRVQCSNFILFELQQGPIVV